MPFTLFILLVALGSDYNIFIMAAIREEARDKPLTEAVAAALAGTSRTINAAGLALAASFALLALVPLQDFFQLGLALALGILLDAFVIRTLLVPALVLLVGRAGFWPSKARAKARVSWSPLVYRVRRQSLLAASARARASARWPRSVGWISHG